MKVEILAEAGYGAAMQGLSLSRLQPVEKMPSVARKLVLRGEPHCKFLRQMKVWLRITAPWYWWKHMDTYQAGVDWPDFQSTSTMYNLLSRPLTQDDFEVSIHETVLVILNGYIVEKKFEEAIAHLPGAYLYTRVICINYSALRRIVEQRKGHKMREWHEFIEQILAHVEFTELLTAGLYDSP